LQHHRLPAFSLSTAPAAAPAVPPNNLPAQLTSFVGREAELAAIRRLLTTGADATRLLTLTGPGGSGKTRLALEVASRMLAEHPDSFADGIFAVTLTHVSDPELAPAAIAGVLGVKEQADKTALQSLSQWLQEKQALLILDNFEQIVAAGPMVANLLAVAPRLFVIVTSRSPLRVYGEQEFPIQPLAVPEQEDSHDPEALAHYASVHLFLTRSRAAKPNFALTSDNAAAIAELCVRLDGLPLALELAAARSKLFSPQAMLARLRDRLSFFADARLPARQQTLRATLDWSYHLLAEEEQRLLGRLAIFTGRFSLEAAERSCALDGDIDVLNALSGLVDHSLVQQVDLDDEERGLFSMLTTVQEYALLLLPATDETRLRQQHALYYASLTGEAHINMSGAGQAVWMARLLAEEENIRAALDWSLREGATAEQVATGVKIVTQLDRFWQIRGRVSEGYGWIMAALSRRVAIPTDYQVRVLNLAGSFAAMQGQLDVAAAHHEEALAVARLLGQSRLEAISLHNLGLTAGRAGDLARANQLLSECLTLYRSTPGISSADLGSLLNNLAIVATRLNEFDRAVGLLSESLALGRERGDAFSMGHALSSLGELARRQGDLAQAATHHRAALLLRNELNNQLGMLFSIQNIADLAIAANNLPLAVRLYGAGEALRQKYNAPLTGHILTDVQSNIGVLRSALPAQEFERLWAIGASLSLDEAVRLALTIA
jgi:predicted ATPase